MSIKIWTGLQAGTNAAWTNANNWIGNSLPVNGDSVIFAATLAPNSGPASTLNLIGFNTSGLTADLWMDEAGESDNIVISAGGTFVLGLQGGSMNHYWNGDASQAATSTINANGIVSADAGQVGGTITLHDNAALNGAGGGGDLYMYNSSTYNGQNLNSAHCYNTSTYDGHCGGNVYMYDSSTFEGGDNAGAGGNLYINSPTVSAGGVNFSSVGGGNVYMVAGATVGGFGVGFNALTNKSPMMSPGAR